MNTKRVFMIVMLGAFLAASAGVSQAGDRMNRSASPEFGTWEYWMAEETGNLPGLEAGGGPAEQATKPASPQFGTWEYWLAEETGTLRGTDVSRHSSEIVERPDW